MPTPISGGQNPMDQDQYNSLSGGASRPPRPQGSEVEDTPLFTEVPYIPTRRTPNSGRPDVSFSGRPASSGASSRPRPAASGGRTAADYAESYGSYTRPTQSRPARSNSSSRPAQPRVTPVYTEISWDQLRPDTDYSSLGRTARPAMTVPGQEEYDPRTAPRYFGGFEQEMDDLFYQPAEQPAAWQNAYQQPGRNREQPFQSYQTNRPYPPYQQSRQTTTPREIRQNAVARQRSGRMETQQPRQKKSILSLFSADRSSELARQRRSAASERQAPAKRPETAPNRNAVRTVPAGNLNRRVVTPPPTPPGAKAKPTGRRSHRGVSPALLMGIFVTVALVIVLLTKVTGRNGGSSVNTRPAQTSAVVTQAPQITPEAVTEATPEATPTPSPTPVPSPTPDGPKARLQGDLVVPAAWGPAVPERVHAVYDSRFERSIMIGNSMVEGFFMWSGMASSMDFVYGTGATVTNVLGTMDLAKITLNASDYYTDIYLMFGLNEVGTDVNSFVQSYKKLVDFIREHQTKANIYIVSVTPVTKEVDQDPNEVQKMDRIRTFNAALKEFCVDYNCWYLDIYSMLLDGNGYLSADYAYAGDGKHFEKSGYVAWANFMKTHYVDADLITE